MHHWELVHDFIYMLRWIWINAIELVAGICFEMYFILHSIEYIQIYNMFIYVNIITNHFLFLIIYISLIYQISHFENISSTCLQSMLGKLSLLGFFSMTRKIARHDSRDSHVNVYIIIMPRISMEHWVLQKGFVGSKITVIFHFYTN